MRLPVRRAAPARYHRCLLRERGARAVSEIFPEPVDLCVNRVYSLDMENNDITSPQTRSLTIAGPNLPAKAKATFEVHAAGCADLKRGYLRTADKMTEDHSSVRSMVESMYSDHMSENEPGSEWAEWPAYEGEFKLAPCCADLPYDEPTAEPKPKPMGARQQKQVVMTELLNTAAALAATWDESTGVSQQDAAQQIADWLGYLPGADAAWPALPTPSRLTK
jgi:hypothetical protein